VRLECFLLSKHELGSEEEDEDGEGGVERTVLKNMDKLLLAQVLLP